MIFQALNEAIGAKSIGAVDMGGSMFVHAFGAYYGLAASFFFQPTRASKSSNMKASHTSNAMAAIGSIFLWMYWPSFNGALAKGVTQHRVVINTVLAIAASCVSAAATCRVLYGKLEMEVMLNATLAGGVAIGSASDIIVAPWATMFIGFIAGVLSAVGFKKIGPFLLQTIGLHDTCGVHSLHGMPAVFGAIISAIAIAGASSKGFPDDYFPLVGVNGGTYSTQAGAQIWALLVTLGLAIFSGVTGGFLASLEFFQPPHALFKDDDHFEEAVHCYPADYKEGGDEVYDE